MLLQCISCIHWLRNNVWVWFQTWINVSAIVRTHRHTKDFILLSFVRFWSSIKIEREKIYNTFMILYYKSLLNAHFLQSHIVCVWHCTILCILYTSFISKHLIFHNKSLNRCDDLLKDRKTKQKIKINYHRCHINNMELINLSNWLKYIEWTIMKFQNTHVNTFIEWNNTVNKTQRKKIYP